MSMILERVEVVIDETGEVITYDVPVELAHRAAAFMRRWTYMDNSMDRELIDDEIIALACKLGDHGPAGTHVSVLRDVVRLKIFSEVERAEFDAAVARSIAALDDGYEAHQRSVIGKLAQAVQAFLATSDAKKWIDDFCSLCLKYHGSEIVGSSDIGEFMDLAAEGLAWRERDRLLATYPTTRALVETIHAKQRAEERQLGLSLFDSLCTEPSCRCAYHK